jgi:hypothetical protein
MKVCPVKIYRSPALPLQHELDRALLNSASQSARWQNALCLTGTCVALQWMFCGTAHAEQRPVALEQANSDEIKTCNQETSRQDQHVRAQIISILNEALENDGRGGFGCLAVNPPAFLSEDEALSLIRSEFAKAGLKPDEKTYTVDHVALPETTTWRNYKRDSDGMPIKDATGEYIEEPPALHPPKECEFDLSFNNGNVRIEYISGTDYEALEKDTGEWCSVSSYDFSDTAKRFYASLARQEDLEPATYGIFFDPLSRLKEQMQRPSLDGLTKEEQDQVRKAFYEKREAAFAEQSKQRLLLQIEHFLAEYKARQTAQSDQ